MIRELYRPAMQQSPSDSIRLIVETMYGDYAVHSFTNSGARLDDIEEMAQYAQKYPSVENFLRELALLSELSGEDVMAGDEENEKLVLSTVHQAKGLEWDVVIIIGMAENQFPSHWAMKDPDGEEEERRVFYVAATRAKDELYLTYPQMGHARGNRDVIQRISRFIAEIDPALYEPLEIELDY